VSEDEEDRDFTLPEVLKHDTSLTTRHSSASRVQGWTAERIERNLASAFVLRAHLESILAEGGSLKHTEHAMALLAICDANIDALERRLAAPRRERHVTRIAAALLFVAVALAFWHPPSVALAALVGTFMTAATTLYTKIMFPKDPK
jgi:hypothetical protein